MENDHWWKDCRNKRRMMVKNSILHSVTVVYILSVRNQNLLTAKNWIMRLRSILIDLNLSDQLAFVFWVRTYWKILKRLKQHLENLIFCQNLLWQITLFLPSDDFDSKRIIILVYRLPLFTFTSSLYCMKFILHRPFYHFEILLC